MKVINCNLCVADSTIPGISFDKKGVCSLCDFHDKLDKIYPENEEALLKLEAKIDKIKKAGKNKKYDCKKRNYTIGRRNPAQKLAFFHDCMICN